VTGDENQWQRQTDMGQFVLQFHAAHAGHADIADDATARGRRRLSEVLHEGFGTGVIVYLHAGLFQNPAARLTKVVVIVDEVDMGVGIGAGHASRPRGSVKTMAHPQPSSSLGSANSRPSWYSMIDRQMANPMPRPSVLVVYSGANNWSMSSPSKPQPWSATRSSTMSS